MQTFYDAAALRKKKGQTAAGQDGRPGRRSTRGRARGSAKNSRGAKLAGEWQLAARRGVLRQRTWDAVRDQDGGGEHQQSPRPRSRAQIADCSRQDRGQVPRARSVRRRRADDGGEGPLRRHPVRLRAEDREHPDPGDRPEQRRRTSRGVRDASATRTLKKYLDEAKGQWIEVLDLAKQGGMSNKWSRRAQENLGREFPERVQRVASGAGAGHGCAVMRRCR